MGTGDKLIKGLTRALGVKIKGKSKVLRSDHWKRGKQALTNKEGAEFGQITLQLCTGTL